jgi:hypothetical protein
VCPLPAGSITTVQGLGGFATRRRAIVVAAVAVATATVFATASWRSRMDVLATGSRSWPPPFTNPTSVSPMIRAESSNNAGLLIDVTQMGLGGCVACKADGGRGRMT